MPEPSVAFVARNEFQYLQFEQLWRAYPGSPTLLVGNETDWNSFLARKSSADRSRFQRLTFREAALCDGVYDIIFFQTPFPRIEEISKSKLVCVQYGLAKERHNYGEWHSLADMNLMFGDYSADAVSHFSPSFAVGNLRFAGWAPDRRPETRLALIDQMGLRRNLPTVLYMPTYRELGSFPKLKQALSQLVDQYNIVIKAHHNEELRGVSSWRTAALEAGLRHIYGASTDQRELLNIADVVISDFSGAIFDALYARVPLVLYQEGATELVGRQKFDLTSIEYRCRRKLGTVCENPHDLAAALQTALRLSHQDRERLDALRSELMLDGGQNDFVALAKARVVDLLEGTVPPLTTSQMYVRELCKCARRNERELARARQAKGGVFRALKTALFKISPARKTLSAK